MGLKSLHKQGLSKPEFHGDLLYEFRKKNVGRNDFSDHLRTIIIRQMNVMQLTAWLVVNRITVDNVAVLFNCMQAGRVSDLMKAPA